MHKIDTSKIKPLAYPTEPYKVRNAFKLGREHAKNHYFGEETDPDWMSYVTWAHNPYTEARPAVYYSFIAGFHEEWSRLLIESGKPVVTTEVDAEYESFLLHLPDVYEFLTSLQLSVDDEMKLNELLNRDGI